MNIYLLENDEEHKYGSYESCVVIAHTVDDAKKIHPSGNGGWESDRDYPRSAVWAADVYNINATLLGVASNSQKEGTTVCGSFVEY